MELLEKIRDFIKNMEEGDFYKYLGAFFGAFFLVMSLLFYIHYRKVNTYKNELKKLDAMRIQTRKLLTNLKIVNLQREKAEEILEQNKDFRIAEAFQQIVYKTGLSSRLTEKSAPTTGPTMSGKTEVQVTAHFASLNMKQVTDLLSAIADVPQLFVKDLTIKKTPNTQTVDIDITVATLEPSIE